MKRNVEHILAVLDFLNKENMFEILPKLVLVNNWFVNFGHVICIEEVNVHFSNILTVIEWSLRKTFSNISDLETCQLVHNVHCMLMKGCLASSWADVLVFLFHISCFILFCFTVFHFLFIIILLIFYYLFIQLYISTWRIIPYRQ